MRSLVAVFTVTCLILSLAIQGNALVGNKQLVLSKPVTRLDSFAFEQGGSLTINGGLTNHENDLPRQLLKFYLCTEREFTSLPSDSFALELDCQRPEYTTRCTAGELLNHTTIQIPIATTQRYRFLLVHCSETPGTLRAPLVNAAISYTALNPREDQLPYGDKPLPKIYQAIAIGWSGLLGVILYRFIRFGARRNALHFAIIGIIVVKAAVALGSAGYWLLYAKQGRRVDALAFTRRIAFAVSETAFFASLLLISKGWRITRFHLRSTELKTLFLALALLLATLVFFSFYSDDYYFLSLMIMYFFMLPKIFSSITKNLRSLEAQIWMANNVQLPDVPLAAFHRKLRMFKILRGSILVYLASILLINSMRIVIVWYWDWINVAISEVVALAVVAVIANVLRPGADGVFTDMTEIASLATLQTLIERSNALENNTGPRIDPWDTNATLIIQYPSKTPIPSGKSVDVNDSEASIGPISMAVREDYDKSQNFEASQQRS